MFFISGFVHCSSLCFFFSFSQFLANFFFLYFLTCASTFSEISSHLMPSLLWILTHVYCLLPFNLGDLIYTLFLVCNIFSASHLFKLLFFVSCHTGQSCGLLDFCVCCLGGWVWSRHCELSVGEGLPCSLMHGTWSWCLMGRAVSGITFGGICDLSMTLPVCLLMGKLHCLASYLAWEASIVLEFADLLCQVRFLCQDGDLQKSSCKLIFLGQGFWWSWWTGFNTPTT